MKHVLMIVIVFSLPIGIALAQDEVPVSDYSYTYHRADSRLGLAAGTEDGRIRVWLSG